MTIDCDYETSGSVVPNTGVLVTNVTYRNISGTVTHPRPRAGGGGGGRRSAARSRAAAAEGHDPSMVVDAAGTFFCRDTRPCSFSMQQVQIAHATPVDGYTNASSSETPPAWLCNNSRLLGGAGPTSVLPGLPAACQDHSRQGSDAGNAQQRRRQQQQQQQQRRRR